MTDSLKVDKLGSYFNELQQEEQRKQRIANLTENLLGKTKLKLKLQTKESRKEEIFNKKLEQMKKLKTFIDAQPTINKMNLLNDHNVLIKLNILKYIKEDEFITPHHNVIKEFPEFETIGKEFVNLDESNIALFQDYRLSLVDKIKYQAGKQKHFNLPKRAESQPIFEDNLEIQHLYQNSENGKYDNNFFYNAVFKSQNSPRKLQYPNAKHLEFQKAQQFLKKQGLIANDTAKKTQLNKVVFQQFYEKYQQDTDNLIKNVKIEAKQRFDNISRVSSVRQISEGTRKLLIKNQEFYKRHGKQASYKEIKSQQPPINQTQNTLSPSKLGYSPIKCYTNLTIKSPCKSQRSVRQFSWLQESIHNNTNSKIIFKNRVQSQMEKFTTTVNQVEENFQNINNQNNKILRRMSTAMTDVQQKYKNDFILD